MLVELINNEKSFASLLQASATYWKRKNMKLLLTVNNFKIFYNRLFYEVEIKINSLLSPQLPIAVFFLT